MHSRLLVLLGGVRERFKQTGQRESWLYFTQDQPKLVSQTTATVNGSPTVDQPQGETTDTAAMQSTSPIMEKNWTLTC